MLDFDISVYRLRYFKYAYFIPITGVGKESRTLNGAVVIQRQHPLLELP